MSRRKIAAVDQITAWVKTAGRLDALRRSISSTGTHAVPHLPAPHLPAPHAVTPPVPSAARPSLKDRLAHTVAAKPNATAPVPAAPAAQATTVQRNAAITTPAAGLGDGVDPRLAQRSSQQARAAVGANNLVNDIHRTSAVASAAAAAPGAASPFTPVGFPTRQVTPPPQEMLDALRRGRTQADAWVAGHGSAAEAQQALRDRALATLPVVPTAPRAAKTGSAGSDGAVMRKMEFAGIPICIETDIGQARKWTDPKTKEERATIMRFPYGYIPDTSGMDDGSVDVFVGPVSDAPHAYIVLINRPPTFDEADEEKVFLGFTNIYDAIGAFLQHYGNKERFIRKVSVVPVDELAASLRKDRVTGTAEGSTKTTSHDSSPNTDEKPEGAKSHVDPTSSLVGALEEKPKDPPEKPKIDESDVKVAAAYLTMKIASALRKKLAAEPATTSIPGFQPYTVTTEAAEPSVGSVQKSLPDNTVYPDTTIDNLFRNVESNAMQTDHLMNAGDIAVSV